jgi:hypothetical protein
VLSTKKSAKQDIPAMADMWLPEEILYVGLAGDVSEKWWT